MSDSSQVIGQSVEPGFVASDESLVRRLRAGESAAGDELVRRHARSLLGYLYHLTASAAVAEEMHQQTWLSVLEHLHRFEERASAGGFKAWLYRIATNKVNDRWRSEVRKKKSEAGLRLVLDQAQSEADSDATGAVVTDEDSRRLREAIENLPDAQKQVVCMRYYAEMKFADVAAVLGCPLNTALGRMHKALAKLRQAMER